MTWVRYSKHCNSTNLPLKTTTRHLRSLLQQGDCNGKFCYFGNVFFNWKELISSYNVYIMNYVPILMVYLPLYFKANLLLDLNITQNIWSTNASRLCIHNKLFTWLLISKIIQHIHQKHSFNKQCKTVFRK